MHRNLAALLLLLLACVKYQPPPPAQPRDGTHVPASMGQTWDAVIDLFAQRNIPIRTIERASGIIATEGLNVGEDGKLWADCGKAGRDRLYPNSAIYNVLVRGDSVSSTVRTTVRWSYLGGDRNLDCTSNYAWELEFEHEVKTRAEAAPRYAASAHASAPVPGDDPGSPQLAQGYSSGSPAGSHSAGVAETRGGSDGVPTGQPSRVRTNEELMRSVNFRQAVSDVRRTKVIAGFQELRPDTLTVDLAEGAFTSASADYNLGRLYIAYRGTTDYRREAALELRDSGQRIGWYTQNGLRWTH
jgi:hypothetical protein